MNQDIYIVIGNTDGKLSSREWTVFQDEFKNIVTSIAEQVWGVWYSDPTTSYINMCIGILLAETNSEALKRQLRSFAAKYNQDSIAWSESKTEFIRP